MVFEFSLITPKVENLLDKETINIVNVLILQEQYTKAKELVFNKTIHVQNKKDIHEWFELIDAISPKIITN